MYRDIINNKRKSMNKDELKKSRELKESIISLINQAIEVKSDQLVHFGARNRAREGENTSEDASIESERGVAQIDSNEASQFDEELEEKRL